MSSWTSSVALRSMAARPPPVSFTFRGHTVAISQEGLDDDDGAAVPAGAAPVDTTGRLVWPCSSLLLRFLEDDARLARLCPHAPPGAQLSSIDLSAGAGLITVALAAAGGRVLATETAFQLVLLRANIAAAGCVADSADYRWGEDTTPIFSRAAAPDFVVCSDVLYIALRDGLSRELSMSLRALAAGARGGLLFGYEERLWREEDAFMASLSEPLNVASPPPLPPWAAAAGATRAIVVEELPPAERELRQEDAVGGEAGGDLGAMFWEPPPFRLFILRAHRND